MFCPMRMLWDYLKNGVKSLRELPWNLLHGGSVLTARDSTYMLERLKILGYLTLHTRQLDMIMGNPDRVKYYKNKLTGDIDRILSGAAGGQKA